MPKWKIILPVLIVAVVGVVAYLQLTTTKEEAGPGVPAPQGEPAVDLGGEMDVTGDEEVGVQADALVDALMEEAAFEESDAGDGSDAAAALSGGGNEDELFNVESYE